MLMESAGFSFNLYSQLCWDPASLTETTTVAPFRALSLQTNPPIKVRSFVKQKLIM